MSKPTQFQYWPDSINPGFGPYRAVCERVVDGDTLYVFLDLGINTYAYESIRLKDVNAPELFSGTDRTAGLAARDKLVQICPVGTKVLLYTEKDAMSFSRYVGTLVRQDGTVVNRLMNDWLEGRQG